MPITTRRGPPADAIVLAAASAGARPGRATFDPAWALAAGRPICAWAVDALADSPHIRRIALVVDAAHLARAERLIASAGWTTVRPIAAAADAEGAPGLPACLRAGLAVLANTPTAGVVLHDAARPLLPASLLDALVAHWDGASVMAAASPVKETLKAVDASRRVRQTPPRDRLWQLHPPLLAPRSLLARLLATDPAPDSDLTALLARAPDARLRLVPAGHDDLVVRRRADVRLVEGILAAASTH